jgi:methyl-accepting chemotaxis protein
MLRNATLGKKIAFGFAALMIICLTLGGVAVFCMISAKNAAVSMSKREIPQTILANQIERTSREIMYQARGYSLSEQSDFLTEAQKNLAEVKEAIESAKKHASAYSLADFGSDVNMADKDVQAYEGLLNDTATAINSMEAEKNASIEAAAKYSKVCSDFVEDQITQFDSEITVFAKDARGETASSTTSPAPQTTSAGDSAAPLKGSSPIPVTEERLKQRVRKIVACNSIMELGNKINIDTWRGIATRNTELLEQAQKSFEEVEKQLDALKATTRQERNLKQIEECRAAGQGYLGCVDRILSDWRRREELDAQREKTGAEVLKAAETTSSQVMMNAQNNADTASSSLGIVSLVLSAGLVFAALLGFILAVTITRSITGPLKLVIEGLTNGSEQTAAAAFQVAESSQAMAEGASDQASNLEETSASLEEITSMVRQNVESARAAKDLAAQANSSADKGGQAMARMSVAITDIKKSADDTAKIIKTIDEIAFQTNLLALNAAVEAARAGDAGKGFAVVAEEVRNLAQRSAEAARSTSSLIVESLKNAEKGVQISNDVAGALNEIAVAARKVDSLVAEIATANAEQAQGVEQVNLAVSQIDKITQNNAANSEEAASASEELSAQARELEDAVSVLARIVGFKNKKKSSAEFAAKSISKVEPARKPSKKEAPKTNREERREIPKEMNGKEANSFKEFKPDQVIYLDDKEMSEF